MKISEAKVVAVNDDGSVDLVAPSLWGDDVIEGVAGMMPPGFGSSPTIGDSIVVLVSEEGSLAPALSTRWVWTVRSGSRPPPGLHLGSRTWLLSPAGRVSIVLDEDTGAVHLGAEDASEPAVLGLALTKVLSDGHSALQTALAGNPPAIPAVAAPTMAEFNAFVAAYNAMLVKLSTAATAMGAAVTLLEAAGHLSKTVYVDDGTGQG